MGQKKKRKRKKIKPKSSSENIWTAVAIFLLALAVRGIYLYESSDNPTFLMPVVDSLAYDQMARNLVDGKGLDSAFFWQPIFYPLFLSLCYKISSCSVLFVKIVQILLGSLTCVLSYKLGKKVFSRSAGIIAGIIASIYMPLVFFEAELLATGWAAFWSVALILAFLRTRENLNVGNCLILGLAGGLSIITRPIFLPFFAFSMVWLLFSIIRDHVKTAKVFMGLASIITGFCIVTVPVATASYRVMRKASILPYSGSVNLYIGNNPNYNETITIRPGYKWKELMDMPANQAGVKTRGDAQEFFKQKTCDYISSDAFSFIKGILSKTTQFISSREMPRNVDIYLFRKWSKMLSVGLFRISNAGIPFMILLSVSFIGLIFNFRKVPSPVWLYLLLYPAAVILVFVTARYRMPIIPVLSILAGCSIISVYRMLKNRSYRKVAIAIVIMFFTCIAIVLPGPFHEEKLDYEAELYYAIGDSLEKHGHADRAVEQYTYAIALRKDYLDAHHNIAVILADKGRHKRAIEHYQKVISIEPEYLSAHKNIVASFLKLNMFTDALKHLVIVCRLDNKDFSAFNDAGNIFAMQGDPEKAILYFQKAFKLQPDDFRTMNNIANAFLSLNKLDQAVEYYRLALKLKPYDAGIHSNLGACLQKQGLTSEAIKEFKTALSIDPNHRSARVSLQKLQQ